jgi:hypothetical protein
MKFTTVNFLEMTREEIMSHNPPSILYTSAACNPTFSYGMLLTAISIPSIQVLLCNHDHSKHYDELQRDNLDYQFIRDILRRERVINAHLDGSKDGRQVFMCKINKTSNEECFLKLWSELITIMNGIVDKSLRSYFYTNDYRDQIKRIFNSGCEKDLIINYGGEKGIIDLKGEAAKTKISAKYIESEITTKNVDNLMAENPFTSRLIHHFKAIIESKLSALDKVNNKTLKSIYAMNLGIKREPSKNNYYEDINTKWLNDEV